MTYEESVRYLYEATPMFQKIGAAAYKPGLETARSLDGLFGNPSRRLRCVHIAGTNGKGSTAHTIAAIMQSAGLRTGLYTSPHLVDFRERIRVDGRMIPQSAVTDFVERYRAMDVSLAPSFFELTTIMAFEWFVRQQVDVAVIETGLGGRLDTTNIIDPILTLVTNISYDHTAQLGNTLEQIAAEKAGIFKPGVPAVVSEAEDTVREVMERRAREVGAPIRFVSDESPIVSVDAERDGLRYHTNRWGTIRGELTGDCQPRNTAVVLVAMETLRHQFPQIDKEAIRRGFAEVCSLTGLQGRWMVCGHRPLVVCDTGHNVGGWQWLARQISSMPGRRHLVLGFVNDKDITAILDLVATIPDAELYFTQASIPRAMPADKLMELAAEHGLNGRWYADVTDAYQKALADAGEGDSVYVGGSTFVVADFLSGQR